MSLRFEFAEPGVADAIEAWFAGDNPETVLRDNIRRRIVRIESASGPLLLKQFRVASGRHRTRETLKALIGASPAAKEARALRRLTAAEAPVPKPLALGRLPDGDRLLALPFIEGSSAEEVLASSDPAARRRAFAELGNAVRAFHATGTVHRDLHHGNVRFAPDRVVLVDLQNARPGRGLDARLRDLAFLLFSFRGRIDAQERDVITQAALGATAASTAERLETLIRERARRYGASRTRRAMRPGRRFAPWQRSSGSGLRQRQLEPERLEGWLVAHQNGTGASFPIKREGRVSISRVEDPEGSVVVKETGVGLGRALADRVRGSAGRRAWRAGHGLLARGIPAAEPLAFAERRVLGLPFASVVVLAAIDGPDGVGACGEPTALTAQLELLTNLHRQAIDHGDLKATNWIHRETDGHAVLVDLEGVRFQKRLSDAQRIEGLAQWNASLPDAVSAADRKRCFERYVEVVPFNGDTGLALREIVRRSLVRRHRWSGQGCGASDA